MPSQSLKFKEIVIAVAEQAGGLITHAPNGGSTSSVIRSYLAGSDGEYEGRDILLDFGSSSHRALIYDYLASANQASYSPNSTTSGSSATLFHILPEHLPVNRIRNAINGAIAELTEAGWVAQRVDESLTGNRRLPVLDIPSDFDIIRNIEVRDFIDSDEIVHNDIAWSELVDGDASVEAVTDWPGLMDGGGIVLTVGAGLASGDIIATHDVSTLDLRDMTEIEFWLYCTTAVAASDLQLLLDDTAQCASPLETLNLPAVSARTPTRIRLSLANPELLSAVISVGLKYAANAAANKFLIGPIRAYDADTGVWNVLDSWWWRVNSEANELHLSDAGRTAVHNKRIRLNGYGKQAQLGADMSESGAALEASVELEPAMLITGALAKLPEVGDFNPALFKALHEQRLKGAPTLQGRAVS